jgi:hypothetical protein
MRRKILSFVLVFALILTPITGLSMVQAVQASDIYYVALGDSVPDGYGLADPETQSYVGLLSQAMDIPVHNLAASGMDTQMLLSFLESDENASELVAGVGSNRFDPQRLVHKRADYSHGYAAV